MEELARMMRQPKAKRRRVKGKLKGRERREARDFYLMIMPWLVGFIFLTTIPLLLGLATAFSNYNGLNLKTIKFVEFDNFARAVDLENKDFWEALANSFKYSLVVVPVGQILSLGLAALLNQKIKGRAFFRMIYYIPAILPLAGAVSAWGMLWNKNSGLINALISLARPGTAINWIYDYFFFVLYMFVWWGAGGGMIIYLAGLQGVPEELKEASWIDGGVLGWPASYGCIILDVGDAEALYTWADVGTLIRVKGVAPWTPFGQQTLSDIAPPVSDE